MSEPSDKPPVSIRPSRSERPGMPRLLATLMVDPTYIIFRVIVAVAEGVTKAILTWHSKRKEKKAEKVSRRTGQKGK